MRRLPSFGRHALFVLVIAGAATYAAAVPAIRWAAVLLAVIATARLLVLWFVGNHLWQGMDLAMPPRRMR